MNNIIKAVALTKIFRTESVQTTALNEVNLEIHPGEFVAIMGPSGCGKSTLLNVMGLLDNPTSGELWFMGQEVSKWKENDRTDLRNGNLGFVFQSFNLIDELTVFENVELPLLYAGVSAREREERVNRALDPSFGALSATAQRWPATACSHCPCHRDQSKNHSGRRADG